MKYFYLIILCCILATDMPAELIRNGSFQTIEKDGIPAEWEFSVKRTERAIPAVTADASARKKGPGGGFAVEFRNPASYINDVYGSLFQHVKVEPGKRYRLNFYLKGENISQLLLIMGKNWNVRWVIPTAGLRPDEWKLFSHEFTPSEKDCGENNDWMIRFNIEGHVTQGAIGGVSLTRVDGELSTHPATASPAVSLNLLPETENIDVFAAQLGFCGLEYDTPWNAELVFTDSEGGRKVEKLQNLRPLKRNQLLSIRTFLPLDIPAGSYTVEIKADGKSISRKKFIKQPSRAPLELKEQNDRLTAASARFKDLQSRLDKIEGAAQSKLLTVYTSVIPQQIALQSKDLKLPFRSAPERDYYLGRGRIAIPELERVLDDLSALVDKAEKGDLPPGGWTFLSGPITYEHGFPVATLADESGKKRKRYFFLGGYGHFQQVIDDMPLLSKIGCNVVQLEIGPWNFFKSPGKNRELEPDFSYYHSYLEQAMKRAKENNIKIALLTSTHYVPDWYRKKYSEAAVGHLFMPLDPLHPKTRELHTAFLDALLPKLAASPYRDVIQTIVLSNEPTYGQCNLKREFSRKEFVKDLKKRYGSITGFNRATGCAYRNFDELVADEEHPAVKLAFNRFKQHALADWHKFLARKVRGTLPEIPLQAKMMVMQTFAERELMYGYDPELFTEFSDLNGNDGGSNSWLDPLIGTDLQYSLKPVAICNTENHFIPDGEQNPVDPEHIYTSVFQQYMHGACCLVGWVWADNNFGGAPWLDGCIQRRPSNIVAHQKAILDANRLAPDIVEFNRAEPEIALLYSPTSLIQHRAPYCKDIFDLYRDLIGSGHKIGFISEKQLAAKQFRNLKLIIAGNVRYMRRDAAAGLETFVRRGGKVLTHGENFLEDEYGRALKHKICSSPLPDGRTERCAEVVRLAPLPVKFEVEGDTDSSTAVEIRTVALRDGRILVNLVNFDYREHRVKIIPPTGKKIKELISDKPFNTKFTLKHKTPVLLEIK